MPCHCSAIPGEFLPCSASVLVAEDLPSAVRELENGKLTPCITAWCSKCQKPYLLTSSIRLFPSPSAHHAHMLTLAKRQHT